MQRIIPGGLSELVAKVLAAYQASRAIRVTRIIASGLATAD